MNKRLLLTLAGAAIAVTSLAGCAASGSGAAPAATGATLAIGKTSLGTILVDGKGDTVYEFTSDTANSGKSTCYGGCASTWAAVTTTSSKPTLKGVTGTVSTIKRTDGTLQVTIGGMPLYTYSGDSKPGDVSGQGIGNSWYVVTPAGTQVTKAPSSSSSTSSTSSGGSGGSGGSGAGGGWS